MPKTLAEARFVSSGAFRISQSGRKIRRRIKIGDDDYNKEDDIDKDGDVDKDDAKPAKRLRWESFSAFTEGTSSAKTTVNKASYSWGKMVTVHHGKDTSYPLHPEHQEAIKKLKDGEKTSFKDETNSTVHAHREGDNVHLTRPKTSSTKTTVAHSHFNESLDEAVSSGNAQHALANSEHGKHAAYMKKTHGVETKYHGTDELSYHGDKASVKKALINHYDDEDEAKALHPKVFKESTELDEKRGLWDNIHAKQKRIKNGSGEKMRKPGSEGAPTAADFKNSQSESYAPVAPVPDKKYIKGTPEHKAHKATKKPINGHPTNVKEAADKGEYDYEGQMARTQLQTICRNAKDLVDMLEDDDNMPEWVQSKITLAQDYITCVRDYLQSKEELGEETINEYSMEDLHKDAADHLKKSIDKASDDRIAALKNPPKKKSFLQRVGEKQINMVKGAYHGLTKEETIVEHEEHGPNHVEIALDHRFPPKNQKTAMATLKAHGAEYVATSDKATHFKVHKDKAHSLRKELKSNGVESDINEGLKHHIAAAAIAVAGALGGHAHAQSNDTQKTAEKPAATASVDSDKSPHDGGSKAEHQTRIDKAVADGTMSRGDANVEKMKHGLRPSFGRVKMTQESKEEDPPFDKPYKTVSAVTTDKSGAEHTGMSRARHIARLAMKQAAKQVKKPVKA